ncbi:hypothetical protein PFISCL1PPCAC_15607, partial [Pristionchus fissidentatus]
ISVFLANVRSIRKKSHILSFIKSLDYSMILLNETWLSEDDSDAFLLGSNANYVSFRKDRPTNAAKSRGGGVAILCSPLLNPILISSFSTDDIEAITIDIHTSSYCKSIPFSSVRVCLIYRAPSYLGVIMQPSLKFSDHVSKLTSKARSKLSMSTLEQRRLIFDLLFLHKTIHNFYSLNSNLLFKISPLTRNLRNTHKLRIALPFAVPKSHSTFATRTVQRWNALPGEIVNSSPNVFRSHILNLPSISFTSESLLRL